MSTNKYSSVQQKELKNHQYVKTCSEKYITFTDHFKKLCIEQDSKGMYHKDIFSMYHFPSYIVDSSVPKNTIGRWKHIIKHKGEPGLVGNKKGRKKVERIDTSKMNKDEYIEYLEAKLAISEALSALQNGKYP